jgi:hypothetical protein
MLVQLLQRVGRRGAGVGVDIFVVDRQPEIDRQRDRRFGHRNPRRPYDATCIAVTGLQDLHSRRLDDLVGVRVHERLVLRRIEPVARLSEAGQSELGDRSVESLGDLPKSTLELTVLARPTDVIEDRKQGDQRIADGEVTDRFAVTFDALAVVGVLGLHPLEIRGSLGYLGAQL